MEKTYVVVAYKGVTYAGNDALIALHCAEQDNGVIEVWEGNVLSARVEKGKLSYVLS